MRFANVLLRIKTFLMAPWLLVCSECLALLLTDERRYILLIYRAGTR